MASLTRKSIPHSDYWSLFDWFGRSCDHVVGIILSPIILVLYARALDDDALRLSWIISAFGLAWIIGAALAPHLHHLTARIMPWIVGAFIVRTSAIALLAYSASDRSSSTDERFRSTLICVTAYAAATGIARTAESRHLLPRPAVESRSMRTWLGTLGTAAMTAVSALAIWSLMTASLSWATVFTRLFTLAAIGLGVASLAAIIRGATTTELPAGSERRIERQSTRSMRPNIAWGLAPGLALLIVVETIGILEIFTEFRRDSGAIRASIAFLMLGWVAGMLILQIAGKRISLATMLQTSVGASAIAFIIVLSLRELSETSWVPDTISGTSSVYVAIYAFAFVLGIAACFRRIAMPIVTSSIALSPATALITGLFAAAIPSIAIWLTDSMSRDGVLIIGLAIALGILIGAGFIRSSRLPNDRPPAALAGQLAMSPRR